MSTSNLIYHTCISKLDQNINVDSCPNMFREMREVQRSKTGPNNSQYQIDALESFKYPIYAFSYSPEMYVLDYADHNECTDSIAKYLNDLIMTDAGANTN